MEQDIEILENIKNIFLNLKYHGYINDIKKDISTDGVINAIENILEERQQDKDKIKELEEENKIIKGNYYTLCADIQMVTSELGFPEDTIIADEMVSMIKENYIPVSLVEETIEEYKQRIEKYNEYKEQGKETDVEFYENITNTAIVQVLQELLERRK